jgi:hypothetical protein
MTLTPSVRAIVGVYVPPARGRRGGGAFGGRRERDDLGRVKDLLLFREA